MERINVLLVEDETNLALIIKDTLEGQDFNIHTASNGEEGLRLFFDIRPDVLVADVMMPRMDGFEMVRRIRQTDRRTPVLFLTARSAVNDVVEGFELGANDYLKKPFGMQELIVRIKALVGRACSYTSPVQEEQSLYEIGNYQLDVRRQVLLYNGITQELSEPELRSEYPRHPARPLGRRFLLQPAQPACIHHQTAPQTGERRKRPYRQRKRYRLQTDRLTRSLPQRFLPKSLAHSPFHSTFAISGHLCTFPTEKTVRQQLILAKRSKNVKQKEQNKTTNHF